MSISTTLAIDYGTSRIGLAISRGSLAEPLQILPNDGNFFVKLEKILAEENVEHIIVGLSENTMAERTREFVKELETRIKIPVQFVDETLSSATVHEKILLSKKRSVRQQPIDHLAAAEFLQEYLDGQTSA